MKKNEPYESVNAVSERPTIKKVEESPFAGEVSHVARLSDQGEVRLRQALRSAKGVWDNSALAARVLIALIISLCVVACRHTQLRRYSERGERDCRDGGFAEVL